MLWTRILSAALSVLETAATAEVRLALSVLHRYARDGDAARLSWSRAMMERRGVNDTLHAPLARLRDRLTRRGRIAPEAC